MSVTSYTPESWRIIHEAKVDFRQRVIQSMIHIVQYDKSLPIIEIKLYSDGKPWELPGNVTDVRVRWGKRDHTYVHTSILGYKEGDRSTVYLEIIDQMTVFYGEHNPVLEVFIGEDKIACSSYIPFYIDRNPVQNSDIESEITPSVIDELKELIAEKQDELVPGENIKNINGESIMGSGNIELPTIEYVEAHINDTNNPHSVTKAQVGLSNVDNTSDSDKPISTATQTALTNIIASINTHTSDTNNPHSVTKAQVGLGSVANTGDSDEPLQNGTTKFTTGGAYTLKTGLETTINTHTSDTNNPHSVTKDQVGLGNVDNTSDLNKPISTATQTALNTKVDKVTGKGLSANDFTDAYKDDVDANTAARHSHSNKSILDNTTASYVAAEKTKLGGIESNAQVNILEGVKVNGTDLTIVDKKVNVDLSAFITKTVDDLVNYYKKSETYNKSEVNDLISSIQTIQILVVESLPAVGQSNIIYLMSDTHGTGDIYDEYLWVNSTQTYEKIGNTDIDLSAYSTTAQMNEAIATAISTALASYYTKTETNTLLNAKVDKITGKGLSTNDYTTSEKTKLEGIESGAQVNTVNSVANKTGDVVLTKSDVGLGSVANTGDSATPVQNGTTKFTTGGAYTLKTGLETAINTHTQDTSNPHGVTKAQVGLGNVDNTSDLNKPISTATQAALNAKQATLVPGTNIKTINGASIMGSGDLEVSTNSIEVVNTLPAEPDDDTIYLSNTNASSAGGIVELPVPTSADAGKVFKVNSAGGVVLDTIQSGGKLYQHRVFIEGGDGRNITIVYNSTSSSSCNNDISTLLQQIGTRTFEFVHGPDDTAPFKIGAWGLGNNLRQSSGHYYSLDFWGAYDEIGGSGLVIGNTSFSIIFRSIYSEIITEL